MSDEKATQVLKAYTIYKYVYRERWYDSSYVAYMKKHPTCYYQLPVALQVCSELCCQQFVTESPALPTAAPPYLSEGKDNKYKISSTMRTIIHICLYKYIHIYIERERGREREGKSTVGGALATANDFGYTSAP